MNIYSQFSGSSEVLLLSSAFSHTNGRSCEFWWLVFFFWILFIFLIALGLSCWARDFSSCGDQGLLFIVKRRLLIVVASLVAYLAHALGTQASVVVVHGLSHSVACGIFLDQELNPRPLIYWQADFYPLYHQGSLSFMGIPWHLILWQMLPNGSSVIWGFEKIKKLYYCCHHPRIFSILKDF